MTIVQHHNHRNKSLLSLIILVAFLIITTRAVFTNHSATASAAPDQPVFIAPESAAGNRLVLPIIIKNSSYPTVITLRLPAVLSNYFYCPAPALIDPLYLQYQFNMPQIQADLAWKRCILGNHSIVVAVIDTGIDLTHTDLAANILPGYNFVYDNYNPNDDHGHGSHVAGIIGALINNLGVIGVAPQTSLLPVKVLNYEGGGYESDVAAGITYAAQNAQILNLSLGTVENLPVIRFAIEQAINSGRVVVAAAGNCGDSKNYMYNGCDEKNQPSYPAAYPGVIAVGAVKANNEAASFSTQGDYVSLAAPGVNIFSTFKNGDYKIISGTSQASPHVAGLAALVLARFPYYTAQQVRQAMEQTAFDLGNPGKDPSYGWGLINAFGAVNASLSAESWQPTNLPVATNLEFNDRRLAPIAPGRIIVKLQAGMKQQDLPQVQEILATLTIQMEIPRLDVYRYQVPEGQEWQYVDALRALEGIDYAGPDYYVQWITP